jgi:predicted RNase H-like HicB family nuclease
VRQKGTKRRLWVMAGILRAIKLEPLEEGGYLATSDELQGLVARGCTVAETMEITQSVARTSIKSWIEYSDLLPPSVRRAVAARRKHRARVRTPATVGLEAAIG